MKKWLALTIASAMLASVLSLSLGARTQEKTVGKEEAPPRMAESKIVAVTVYPDSALVTREVDVPVGMGNLELVVNPLPEHTLNSTLYTESSDGIRVLSTRFRQRPVKEDTREEVRKLEDDLRKLKNQQESITADQESLTQNMALFTKLDDFTVSSTKGATEKGKLDSDSTIALAKYLMEGRSEKKKEIVKLSQQLSVIQEQMEYTSRKYKELTAGSNKTERDAVIIVEKVNNAPGKIRLNYLVDRASWLPQYKIRAGKLAKDPVQVEYLAAIKQQTGEDWQGVDLTLSTAQPMLNAAPPDLKILAVNIVQRGTKLASNPPLPTFPGQGGGLQGGAGLQGQAGGVAANSAPIMPPVSTTFANPVGNTDNNQLNEIAKNYRQQAQQRLNAKDEGSSNTLYNYAGALEQAGELVLGDDEGRKGTRRAAPRPPKNEGPSVTYHLSARLTVPSRNDEQVLEVARLEMAPEYFYKAVPVLTPHVYRQANLVNKSKYVLLPGEATMYHDKDFVGRMNLPLVAVGEQFTAGFGAEPQLQVQRLMVDKSHSQQGGNQILNYNYRILINSYKDEKVKVQLWDRMPQAENETMGVTLVKSTPEISTDDLYVREERPNNLLRWDLEVEPDQSGKKAATVKYEFKLELDRQMTIGSFQSK